MSNDKISHIYSYEYCDISLKILINEIYKYNISLKTYEPHEKIILRTYCMKLYNEIKTMIRKGYKYQNAMGRLTQINLYDVKLYNSKLFLTT